MLFEWSIIAKGILPNPQYLLKNQKEATLVSQLVFGEARNQDYEGKKAVISVAVNRWKKYKNRTLKDVLLEKDQFTCFSPKDINYKKLQFITIDDVPVWIECVQAALSIYLGLEKDNTGGAVNYLTKKCYQNNKPDWDWSHLIRSAEIGDHIFFKEI